MSRSDFPLIVFLSACLMLLGFFGISATLINLQGKVTPGNIACTLVTMLGFFFLVIACLVYKEKDK